MRWTPHGAVVMALAWSLTACGGPGPAAVSAPPSAPAASTPAPTPASGSASASAEPAPAAYLALGDSVAAGVGASRPALGYVPLLADKLRRAGPCAEAVPRACRIELLDRARSGATSAGLVRDALPEAVRLLEERNGNENRADDVRLITLTSGGNDVFEPVLAACANGVTPQCASVVDAQLDVVAANYETALRRLRAAAGPGTTVAVMTYYNPLPACPLASLTELGDAVLEGGGQVERGLNDIVRARAAAHGALVVETAPVVDRSEMVPDCLHPADAGHADIAEAFAAVVASPLGR